MNIVRHLESFVMTEVSRGALFTNLTLDKEWLENHGYSPENSQAMHELAQEVLSIFDECISNGMDIRCWFNENSHELLFTADWIRLFRHQ